MKIAYHFDADSDMLGCCYGEKIHEALFGRLMDKRNINLVSKIFVGDLVLAAHSSCREVRDNGNGVTTVSYHMDDKRYRAVFQEWLTSVLKGWNTFDVKRMLLQADRNIYTVCFESIDLANAVFLDTALKDYVPYLGAAQVVESIRIHWDLYGVALVPYGRIMNRRFALFYDDWYQPCFYDSPELSFFSQLDKEKLNSRYTIFDRYHDYEHAKRVSEWKERCGSMLAFMADDIVSRLSDAAPDVADKLWSALTCFECAETNEQYAQVMASCRRIFEYVVDKVAPQSDTPTETGHSIKRHQYRNRLYEYVLQSRASDTNIDLILASTDHLSAQWDKLNALANKGVHGEIYRDEARRCFVRTILLLDDIISFRNVPYAIHTEIDQDVKDGMAELLNSSDSKDSQ